MARMKIAEAEKILKDSRYSDIRKKEARKVMREAKVKRSKTTVTATKAKPRTKVKTTKAKPRTRPTKAKPRTRPTKAKPRAKSRTRIKAKPRTRPTKAKKPCTRTRTAAKTRTIKATKTTRTRGRPKKTNKRAIKRRTKIKPKTKQSRNKTIRFYDVKNSKYVKIPRENCRLRKNPKSKGGDQLVGKYRGRKLYTFVKKGYKL